MPLKDHFEQDQETVFNAGEFAKEATYFVHGGGDFETTVIEESFLSLETGNEKETQIVQLKKKDFANKPKYRDKISVSGVSWTVERIVKEGEINYSVLARRGERGKY